MPDITGNQAAFVNVVATDSITPTANGGGALRFGVANPPPASLGKDGDIFFCTITSVTTIYKKITGAWAGVA